MEELTHLNKNEHPKIVNVGGKSITKRSATAQSILWFPEEIYKTLAKDDFKTKKGSVFQTAVIAGIMGAKKTSELIPMCHPLFLENCEINIECDDLQREIKILCTADVEAKTGVEMETLTGASVAALTIYDMCKALGHEIIIKEIKLIEKTGGKSDFKQ
ncbi:cyclic pyranopterin monophosphate synthase MoaC [Chryseobacterium wanjuense]